MWKRRQTSHRLKVSQIKIEQEEEEDDDEEEDETFKFFNEPS